MVCGWCAVEVCLNCMWCAFDLCGVVVAHMRCVCVVMSKCVCCVFDL